MPATVGSPAPAFTLKDQDRKDVSLADLVGKKSLVVFIPFPFSSICSAELCTIRDNLSRLNDVDANVVVITCNTIHVHKKWSEEEGFTFPVLSDYWPHGAVAQAYGCFDEMVGAAKRTTYVLDADGVVREVIATGALTEPRDFESYTAALARI